MNGVVDRSVGAVSEGPAPEWADLSTWSPMEGPKPEQAAGGTLYWLTDTQVDITGPEQMWLTRRIFEATSPDGLQSAATHQIDIDPSYQRLIFHHFRVIRDGVTRTVDPLATLEIVRRERDLERAVFDGRITAIVTIPDIRVGDKVDVCYSCIGANPVFGGRFCTEWLLNWMVWVGETRVRLIASRDRKLVTQSWNLGPDIQATLQEEGGTTIRTWYAKSTPPVRPEQYAPRWVRQFASVRVGEDLAWSDVAEIFAPFYDTPALPESLLEEVNRIGSEASDAAERVILGLRFVQGVLRYHAVTFGEGGFVPRTVDTIWNSRSGDCKDASRLLTAILRHLGISAEPALVNMGRGKALNDEMPSLSAFNHCIVGVSLDGKRYWLDATSFPQGGDLDTIQQVRAGYALALRPGAELEYMGDDPVRESFRISEVIILPAEVDSAGRLEVTSSYFGWRADALRRNLAAGLAAFTERRKGQYEQRFGTPASVDVRIEKDDLKANHLMFFEKVELQKSWRMNSGGGAEFSLSDNLFGGGLPLISNDARRFPIDLGPPLQAVVNIELRLPVAVPPKPWNRTFEMDGLRADSTLHAADSTNKVLYLDRSLTFSRSILEPEDMAEYIRFRRQSVEVENITARVSVHDGMVKVNMQPPRSNVKPPQRSLISNLLRLLGLILFLIVFLGAVIGGLRDKTQSVSQPASQSVSRPFVPSSGGLILHPDPSTWATNNTWRFDPIFRK